MAIDWGQAVVGPCVAIFGEALSDGSNTPIYLPVQGLPYVVNGVFDNGVIPVELNDPTSEIYTPSPVLGCALAAFAAEPRPNDRVFIPRENITYTVKAVTDDSHGGIRLDLLETVQHAPGYWPPGAPGAPS